MGLIQRRQAAVMNQHYQRYSLDYFLDAQQRIGFTSIELWCGAQHFWLDDQHYDDCFHSNCLPTRITPSYYFLICVSHFKVGRFLL